MQVDTLQGLPLEILYAMRDAREAGEITDEEAIEIIYDWPRFARPEQRLPGTPGSVFPDWVDWFVWLIMAGRGYGKSRTGAETIRGWQEEGFMRFHLVSETAADVRDVMVEGEAGILAISHPNNMPKYEPSKRRLTWPNGAVATTFSGDAPDQLRGPQAEKAWADEPAKWKHPEDAWNNLEMGIRLGANPQIVATTTPRPIPLIVDMIDDEGTVVTGGSTYDNIGNLSPKFIDRIVKKYEGTRLGQQELHALLLDDVPGALWNRELLEDTRVRAAPPMKQIAIGVDPAVSDSEKAGETGIIAVGMGIDDHIYVLDDRTLHGGPHARSSMISVTYHTWEADRVIGEVNNGGDWIGYAIRNVDPTISYRSIHASRGKLTRAEPVAAIFERGEAHMVGLFAELEDQLCTWVPGETSPDRLDAMVWAIWYLALLRSQPGKAKAHER